MKKANFKAILAMLLVGVMGVSMTEHRFVPRWYP